MGSIRTLLAISVAIYHSYTILGERLTGGTVAVQLFYIISGFYMALILEEKYKPGKGTYRLFISNRFLRIFPVYWACLLIVLVVCVVGKLTMNQPFYLWYWTSQWNSMQWGTIALVIFFNLFLLGSDWLMFLGLDHSSGKFQWTENCYRYAFVRNHQPLASQFLFIPQIWSVGIEILFYLIAPFLLRRKWYVMLLVLLASLAARCWVYAVKGWNYDPWTYRFFPFEIAFFMAGALAYKAYAWLKEKGIPKWTGGVAWTIVVALIFFYPHISFIPEENLRWCFYALFFLLLPLIFHFTRNSRIDRMIGELSYPVYISHHLLMFVWRQYFWSHPGTMQYFGIATVGSSLVFALILWQGVIVPLDKVRQRRVALNA